MQHPSAARRTLVLACAMLAASCTSLLGIDHDYGPAAVADASADSWVGASEGGADAAGEKPRVQDGGDGAREASDGGIPFPADAGAATKLTAGRFHTCALFGASGVAKCWGRNDDFGELGNGTFASSAVPLYSMTPGLADLFAGAHATCGVRAGGGGECAGKGGLGELGDGVVDADSPVPVPTSAFPAPLVSIAAGDAFACAVTSSGEVWCVGDDTFGELGDGGFATSTVPVRAQLGGAAKSVAAFHRHACALMADGTVACWGDDSSGQLGNGTATPDAGVASPAVVPGIAGALAVGVGDAHSCALVADDAGTDVWCWGDNGYGQLGNGTTAASATPVLVQGATGGQMLAVGGAHACVATPETGGIVCWGKGASGELGNGSTADSPVAVAVSGIGGNPESLAAGGFHTCALLAWPDVRCWGSDDFGQLGDGMTSMDETSPVRVTW